MKHRKYTCFICKRQVKKDDSILVEIPCNKDKFPSGVGRARVCKSHETALKLAIVEPAEATEKPQVEHEETLPQE